MKITFLFVTWERGGLYSNACGGGGGEEGLESNYWHHLSNKCMKWNPEISGQNHQI